MDYDILESYRNNILKRFDSLVKEIRIQQYKTPSTQLKDLLDKAESDFFNYCEKYSYLLDEYYKDKS